jgi:hypothetical protein
LDKGALADAWTPLGGFAPEARAFDEVGPKGEEAALGRLGGVDVAALRAEEGALFVGGFAEAAQVFGAVEIAGFELGLRETEVAGGVGDVLLGEIDEAFLLAAAGAAGLAGEA